MERKNIVVSGASKGIGKEIIRQFYVQGFDVAFCARNAKDLNQLKNELNSDDSDQRVLAISCDMSVKEDVELFADQVLFEFEQVDVLVNNAGIFLPGKLSEEEAGLFEKTMQTNLYSAYYLTRALLPSMKANSEGAHVFNMCSTASTIAYPNGGSYCISKFAMLGMNKVLREELKETLVAVTAILPGPTYTASWEGADIPKSRFMAAEDIAHSVWNAYELSPRAVVEELVIRPQAGDIL